MLINSISPQTRAPVWNIENSGSIDLGAGLYETFFVVVHDLIEEQIGAISVYCLKSAREKQKEYRD